MENTKYWRPTPIVRQIFKADVHPMISMITTKHEILVYDFQKQKILNYLVGHSNEVKRIIISDH